MMFVLLTRYTTADRDEAVLEAHRNWLFPKYEDGTFIFSGGFGSFVEGPEGELSALALLQAESYEEAKALVDSEPFFVNGNCTQDLLPFTARVRASGLDAIFGDDLIVVTPATTAS
ncbi:MAG: YCII-related domain [Subtercola sp.]|nr:YCII-related domain [Subtercola sp.]